MNNAVQGLLLSGLVLPGLGQMVLKHYFRGVVFMLASLCGLIILSVDAIRIMTELANTVAAHLDMMDIDRIMVTLNERLAEISMRSMGLVLLVIVLAWIVSMVDAYRIGRRMDEQAADQAAADE